MNKDAIVIFVFCLLMLAFCLYTLITNIRQSNMTKNQQEARKEVVMLAVISLVFCIFFVLISGFHIFFKK